MSNNSNSQDDEPKPVPPGNEAGGSQKPEQPAFDENPNEPGHGTVADVENADNGSDCEIDATIAGIESMDMQEDEGDDPGVGTVDVHHINLVVTIPRAHETDLFTIGRHTWADVHHPILRQALLVLAVEIH